MSKTTTFKELRARRDDESRARVDAKIADNRQRYALVKLLRQERGFTQAQLAEVLDIAQKNVSAMESRDDIHLSTLKRVVQALGGQLAISVDFDDGEPVKIAL